MTSKKFTPEEDQILRDNYLTLPAKRLSKILGRSESGARQRIKLLGLFTPPEITAQFKANSQFKKGKTPINKGKKQIDYMSPEAIDRTKAIRFKKGNIPVNCYHEIGKITIRKDTKTDRPYKYICLKLGVWVLYHKYEWEKVNGKVQNGYCLWFIDGNTMNCDLTNLECISRKENRFRNASHQTLSDGYLARCLVGKNGDPSNLLDQPELLASKKAYILLNRKIKQHEK